jgi:hypothetical protein
LLQTGKLQNNRRKVTVLREQCSTLTYIATFATHTTDLHLVALAFAQKPLPQISVTKRLTYEATVIVSPTSTARSDVKPSSIFKLKVKWLIVSPTFSPHPLHPIGRICHQLSKLVGVNVLKLQHHAPSLITHQRT